MNDDKEIKTDDTIADTPIQEQPVEETEAPAETGAPDGNAADEEPAPENEKPRQPLICGVYEYAETFCYAVTLMIILFMFVFRYVSVVGESMRETLQNDDKLIISNMFYTPEQGDIIVVKFHPDPLIKRVIATGGQKVKINFDTWQVWVDGELLIEDYIRDDSPRTLHNGAFTQEHMIAGENACEFTVDAGKVFVMGDNRNNSSDSRAYGLFETREIIGRVVLRVMPNTGVVK